MNKKKFRVWHKDLGYVPMKSALIQGDVFLNDEGELICSDDVTLEQYIGIDDDNDVEIYVGDILRYSNEDGIFEAVIYFSDGIDDETLPRYKGKNKIDVSDRYVDDDYVDMFEVIGNIHESK